MVFWYWAAAACLLSAVVAACSSFVRFRIRYSRSGKLDQLIVIVHALFGLFRIHVEVPTIQISKTGLSYHVKEQTEATGAGQTAPKTGKRLINLRGLQRLRLAVREMLVSVRELKGWMFDGLRKIECTRYRMDIRIGTGDAASTAVATGLCWTFMGIATGALDRFFRLKTRPHGQVKPVYAGVELSVVWEADFRIRAGAVLAHALRLLPRLHYGSALRKAYRDWRSVPTQATRT
ncbi:DUF2953 domain-containing protein [Cohnella rhizosphaerae]|uniref:DUF2953 domain-containing protein n=1 Tax=Cohnella rhizosphaerae TaxID=1457232 RepID=A0A9X4QW58_9BACL|nr:DUF2953 domain-containing protein [Cohnella rhizosphaerae]MDG0813148.1 DUF2953 domain-containing protein [Cohnella rhizosphaerae]